MNETFEEYFKRKIPSDFNWVNSRTKEVTKKLAQTIWDVQQTKTTALQTEITKLKDELRKERACIDQIASPFIINRHFDSIKELVLERQKERREI